MGCTVRAVGLWMVCGPGGGGCSAGTWCALGTAHRPGCCMGVRCIVHAAVCVGRGGPEGGGGGAVSLAMARVGRGLCWWWVGEGHGPQASVMPRPQAYQIYNGMGTDNDVSQQTDQILRELARVQAKLRNPAANLPQVRYRLNQFVQLLDGVRESCPWLNVDEDLKGLIERQACHLGASLQTKPAPGHAAAVLPVAFPERTLPPATLPGFDAGPLKVGVWDADLPHCLLGDAKGKGPAVEPEDKTYTLEDALREALQAEIETRSKRERCAPASASGLGLCSGPWRETNARCARCYARCAHGLARVVLLTHHFFI